MELYAERGYEQTTVAEIAERAGLTARTFFRYFADKREVLFAGSEALGERLVAALDAAPADGHAARRRGRRARRASPSCIGERPRLLPPRARRSSPRTPSCRSAS